MGKVTLPPYMLWQINMRQSTDEERYGKDHEAVKKLFDKHRYTDMSFMNLNYHFSPAILEAMEKMIETDPKIKFTSISSERGTADIGYVTSRELEPVIREIEIKLKVKLDDVLMNRAEEYMKDITR